MSATVLDVTCRCGIAPGIVSRVLSADQAEIDPQTRDKILNAAKELGYVESRQSHSLGVLFMDESAKGLTHPFFAKLLIARIEDAENVRWLPVFVPVELLNGGTVGRIG